MNISEILKPQAVFILTNVGSKKQLLQEISVKCEEMLAIAKRDIFDALFKRETLGTTNIGGGIAVPHANLCALENLTGIFILLQKPVVFDSQDGEAVDIVFTLLAPKGSDAGHLKALSKVSRTLREPDLISSVRNCESADAIYSLLTQQRSAQAA